MRRVLVVDVVGLSASLLGDHTPHLSRLAERGFQAELGAVLPALTCSAQSTLLTGKAPSTHGVVGNGWYFRDLSQVWFWRQSNHLVQGEKLWDLARKRDSRFTCAQLFLWFNMYATVDWSVTPRPAYFADGRKSGDVYSEPPELRERLRSELGPFPFMHFWGPGSGLASSKWIADATRVVMQEQRPTLTLAYLPHLDYDLQRYGPCDPEIKEQVSAVDRLVGELVDAADALDTETIVVSEYGITEVVGSVSLNRVLRREGFLRVQRALNGELLDCGASRAFAVCDHQIAHVYVRRPEDVPQVKRLLESVDGVGRVLDRDAQRDFGLDHERSGELVALSESTRWFDYYYWLDDADAPDFARTVDIHQKPGYDPLELFLDPEKPGVRLRVMAKLLAKKLGFRSLLDVIPLTPELVRGSHGLLPASPADGPLLISSSRTAAVERLEMADVCDVVLETLFSA